MAGKVLGVTHQQFDFDGGSCLRLLERNNLIDESVFGEEKLQEKLNSEEVEEVIFVDMTLEEGVSGVSTYTYDHHQMEDPPAEEPTAFDILLEQKGPMDLDPDKLPLWKKLVWMGDRRTENDNMDIARILKRLHLTHSDEEIYRQCFVPVFDGFFDNSSAPEENMRIFQEVAQQFLVAGDNIPGADTINRWLERMEDPDKLFRSSPRNFCHYLIYLDRSQATEWTELILQGVHEEQRMFEKDVKDFLESNIHLFGNIPVITSLNSSPTFLRAARYMIYSNNEQFTHLEERIKDRNSPWILIKVDPKNKNFQVFVNAGRKIGQAIFPEIIKGLRAEILLKRREKVPKWPELIVDGTLSGTEPLYYNKVESGFSNILWGSLKRPAPPAKDFGKTASKILESLTEIVRHGVDREYFPSSCDPDNCKNCPIFPWQLKKCYFRRKNNT